MEISKMNGPELVSAYNNAAKTLGRKSVKRFSDIRAARRRVKSILDDLEREGFNLKTQRGRRRLGFNFPASEAIKGTREGTLRAAILTRLEKGDATFEDIQEAVRKYDISQGKEPYDVRIRAYEATRLLHTYVGYGMRENPQTGVIKLLKK